MPGVETRATDPPAVALKRTIILVSGLSGAGRICPPSINDLGVAIRVVGQTVELLPPPPTCHGRAGRGRSPRGALSAHFVLMIIIPVQCLSGERPRVMLVDTSPRWQIEIFFLPATGGEVTGLTLTLTTRFNLYLDRDVDRLECQSPAHLCGETYSRMAAGCESWTFNCLLQGGKVSAQRSPSLLWSRQPMAGRSGAAASITPWRSEMMN